MPWAAQLLGCQDGQIPSPRRPQLPPCFSVSREGVRLLETAAPGGKAAIRGHMCLMPTQIGLYCVAMQLETSGLYACAKPVGTKQTSQ